MSHAGPTTEAAWRAALMRSLGMARSALLITGGACLKPDTSGSARPSNACSDASQARHASRWPAMRAKDAPDRLPTANALSSATVGQGSDAVIPVLSVFGATNYPLFLTRRRYAPCHYL